MEINRKNYELFFLLYTDNELSAAERKSVEHFIAAHTDLKNELAALMLTRLPASDCSPFPSKECLYKTTGAGSAIHDGNYEEYFLLYGDNELSPEEQIAVEQYVTQHPLKQQAFHLLLQVKCIPDQQVVFPDKASLYFGSKPAAPVIFLHWRRIVAAASVLAIGTWIWMNAGDFMPAQQVESNIPATAILQYAEPKARQINKGTNNNATILAKTSNQNTGTPTGLSQSVITRPTSRTHSDKQSLAKNYTAKPKAQEKTEPANLIRIGFDKTVIPVAPAKEFDQPASQTTGTLEEEQPVPDPGAERKINNVQFDNDNTDIGRSLTYWDTQDTEKRQKGIFRGLLRRASRVVDHVTNPDTRENQSIVRVAGFEIVKK